MNGFSELAGLAGGCKRSGKFERMMLRRAKLGLQAPRNNIRRQLVRSELYKALTPKKNILYISAYDIERRGVVSNDTSWRNVRKKGVSIWAR